MVACKHSTVAQPVTECASWIAGRDPTLSKGATCKRKESRGSNKRSARTRGEILKSTAKQPPTLNSPIPSGVKGASALRLSLRDPRRGDWIDTRNNFTRPTAAVPLAGDFTTARSTGSARLGCEVLLGVPDETNLLVGTR